jgi:ferredoxin
MAKITLNQEKCIGCGACASICPSNFEMKDDGKAHVKKSEVKKITCEEDAAEGCPVQAITLKK